MSSWTLLQFEAGGSADALEERIQGDRRLFAPDDEPFSIRRMDGVVYVQVLSAFHSSRSDSSKELAARYAEDCNRIAIATANDVSNRGRAVLYDVVDGGLDRVVHMRGTEQRCLTDVVIRFEEEYDFRLRGTASENHDGELNFGIKFYDATEGFDPMYETARELEQEVEVDELDEEWWD